ncbi:MAG: hypothetical protein KC593_10235 [Myxococcales bacterium]|nr:hypothetical protein [Myxococcales bacterium]MCB9629856.1 hypothetical protein [Sandaracinaceae bacterium]
MLQLLCSSGVDLMAQMPLLSECLHRLVPSFSLSMIRVDERCVPTAHYSEHFNEASHALFAQSGDHFSARTSDPSGFANLMANANPVGSLVDGRPEYLAGLVYQHLFQPNGIHHTLDVALRDGREPLAILGIFREQAAPGFAREHIQTMRAVYPHLVHACRADARSLGFDELDSALIVVDADGRIAWASTAARSWLAEGSFGGERTLLLEEGVVPEACKALVALVRRAGRMPRVGETLSVPHVNIPVPGGRLSLRGYALEDGGGAPGGYVGIQVRLEVDRGLRILRALDDSGLTPQQLRIAWGLVLGQRNAELCASLEIGATTLKSYQKDMYRRLEVGGAQELTARVTELAAGSRVDRARHQPRA